MTLRNRFMLVGFGVVVFAIITPFLVLYARGFKINWDDKTLVKTGALVVNSEPEKAKIFLNDEIIDQTTPANIRFLLPEDYTVRVEHDGYQSWTKRLSVRSQLVTWANMNREFITLFLSTPILEKQTTISEEKELFEPEEVIDPIEIQKILSDLDIEVPKFSSQKIIRNENQIYLILDNILYIVNEGLEKIYSPVTFAHWNQELHQLLYSNDNEIYVYYADWKNSELILRSRTTIKNPILNPETGYAFYENEGKIKAIELDGRDHRNIFTIADAAERFEISDDAKTLYTLSGTNIKVYRIR